MHDAPKRKMIRLQEFDYSMPAAYFITICIQSRKPILWVSGQHNVLSSVGKIVAYAIEQIPVRYPMISVDTYCVMPDHVHMILSITTDENGMEHNSSTISTVVGQMKRWVSMQIGEPIWQKSFIDRIIRDEKGYQAVWEYIAYNPQKMDTANDMPDFDKL